MRIRAIILVCLAVFLPKDGTARAVQATPGPQVTAADAVWQFNSEPILFAGLIYYPTRETRFFDPMLMTQIGVFRGVPIYADVTLQPYSVVYVPVGRGLMRAWEINPRRDVGVASDRGAGESSTAVGTGGSAIPPTMPMTSPVDVPRPARTHIESIPPPVGPNGIWLEFDGRRWYSDGPALVFSPDRFTKIGEYRGFEVYRETRGASPAIWVEVVKNGPVAPYTTR